MIALGGVGVLSCTAMTQASMMQVRFYGTVSSNTLSDGPFRDALVGESVMMEYTIDSMSEPIETTGVSGATYAIADNSFMLQVGAVTEYAGQIDNPVNRALYVYNNFFNIDSLSVQVDTSALGGLVYQTMDDFDADEFNDVNVPTGLDLAGFEEITWRLTTDNGRLNFDLTDYDIVPAPGALFAAGCGLLMWSRRRRV